MNMATAFHPYLRVLVKRRGINHAVGANGTILKFGSWGCLIKWIVSAHDPSVKVVHLSEGMDWSVINPELKHQALSCVGRRRLNKPGPSHDTRILFSLTEAVQLQTTAINISQDIN